MSCSSWGGFDESLRRAVDYDLVLRLSNLAPPSLAPILGAVYADTRQDEQRISVAESPTWNSVVSQRHLIDLEHERGRDHAPGRVSIVVPIRNRVVDATALVSSLRDVAPDQQIVIVVAGQQQSLARALAVATIGSTNVDFVYWPADLNWAACVNLGATRATGEYLVAGAPTVVRSTAAGAAARVCTTPRSASSNP